MCIMLGISFWKSGRYVGIGASYLCLIEQLYGYANCARHAGNGWSLEPGLAEPILFKQVDRAIIIYTLAIGC